MATGELLEDDAPSRARWVAAVALVLLVALVGGGAALRSSLPPPPLEVRVAELAGSALDGESFVRLHVLLQGSGVDSLGDARLTYAGTSGRGLHPVAFDGNGRMTVQVDLTPACPPAVGAPASLDLSVRDDDGRDRQLRVDVPEGTPLERLVRYRCRTA